ncbi:hypothetical protein FNF27_02649 [Cafeteria roenbergensis]|uniref:Lipase-like C-terminal domain-containing protein n=1 Tax=Cafeteria roenbergensis TaxID=33653 RepID=A0A5A8EF88_CAFRO|nr:hypothetical protein FNF27_02649 [Cafeteria roenbergensis]
MSGPAPTRLQEPKASLGFPVVCIPGFLAPSTGLRRYWGALTGEIDDEQHRARCLCPAVSGVGSVHERACQVFYALVGGRVDYGEAHAARHGCERFGATIPSRSALHPEWSAQRPVHLIGHSFGGQTARMLIQLLHERAFASHPNTSAEWVASCVAVSAPLCGALATSTLGADPAVLAQWDAEQRGAASRGLSAPPAASESRSPGQATAPEGAAAATAAKAALQSAQWSDASVPYVRWFSAGHLLGAAVHAAEWADLDALRGLGLDFQLTHLGLARSAAGVVGGFVDIVRGLIPGGRSRLYQTTNCAPFDLSVHGAARLNRRTTAQPGVMFASVVGMGAGKGLSRERDVATAAVAAETGGSAVSRQMPGFSAKRWLQGGHDGLASEFTQTAPLVYDADGGACRHAPVREGLPRAGEAAELGVWHVLRVESDHLGIVPSPCDGELARSVLEQVVGALAASERARASLRADAATGSNRVACGSSGL